LFLRLTAGVVTGKLDVRAAIAKLHAEIELTETTAIDLSDKIESEKAEK
jgi:hypothetical protein